MCIMYFVCVYSETSGTEAIDKMGAISQLSGNICLFDTDFLKKNREENQKYTKLLGPRYFGPRSLFEGATLNVF